MGKKQKIMQTQALPPADGGCCSNSRIDSEDTALAYKIFLGLIIAVAILAILAMALGFSAGIATGVFLLLISLFGAVVYGCKTRCWNTNFIVFGVIFLIGAGISCGVLCFYAHV